MKRAYKTVAVVPAPEGAGDRFVVILDGRPVHSPAQREFALPTRRLADAVAGEWRDQGETVDPKSMAMMGFASTVADRITPQRAHVVNEIAGYGGSDLLCFLADGPEELVARQQRCWTPWRCWAEQSFGVSLAATSGIMPVRQDAASRQGLRTAVDALDDWHLAPMHTLTTITGSLVLALAVHAGALAAEAAFDLSQIDESFQAEQWGQDREAEQRRRRLREEIRSAARFLELLES